jgi:hypothetical protein
MKASTSPCTMPTSARAVSLSLQKIYDEINECIWSTAKKQEAGYKTEIGRQFH